MKEKFTFLKMSLVGLFLTMGFVASGQIDGLDDFPAVDGTEGVDALTVGAVYCLTDGITIPAASINGGVSTGLTYHWSRIDGNDFTGTPADLGTTTDGQDFTNTPAAPGYYIYRVYSETAELCASPVTEFMVYVLPGIEAQVAQTTGASSYCENSIPTDAVLTASATPSPSVTETFAYTWEWFKDGSATPIAGATSSTLAFSDGTSYNGSYTAKAKYVIAPTCAEDTSDPVTITETAAPTKPTITF